MERIKLVTEEKTTSDLHGVMRQFHTNKTINLGDTHLICETQTFDLHLNFIFHRPH